MDDKLRQILPLFLWRHKNLRNLNCQTIFYCLPSVRRALQNDKRCFPEEFLCYFCCYGWDCSCLNPLEVIHNNEGIFQIALCGGKQPYYAKAPSMQMPSINFVSCEGASFRGENFWHASRDGTTQFATYTMPGQ